MDAKLKALHLRLKKSDGIIAKREKEAIERQRASIVALAGEIDELRGSIQEAKFIQGETEEDVESWSEDVETQLSRADESVVKLRACVKEIDTETSDHEREHRHGKAMELEKQLLDQKLEAAIKQNEISAKTAAVKLPKLSITPFNGTAIDWLRFESQFSAMIDSQSVSAVAKFSHLKELLAPRVRNAIDGLPFNEDGYKRAINYLRDKYGNPDELAGAYVINLLEIPAIIDSRDLAKIHHFYEKLLFNVESLQTLGKLESVQGVAYYVIVKKLEPLRSELATHVTGDWRSWTFANLLEALRKWTTTNPIAESSGKSGSSKRASATSERAFHSQDRHVSICVYCDGEHHRSSECDKVSTPEERKAFLANNKLCFNCAAGQHNAISCPSKLSCRVCRKRHHTSLCVESSEPSLTTNIVGSSVVHPVVIVEVGGQKFRALLDSGASHSYVSSTLIEHTRARAVKSGTRRVATLLGVTTTKLLEYDLRFRSVKRDFELNARVTEINKRELLLLDNPRYADRIEGHSHLHGVQLDDQSAEEHLPVHIILGANEYAQIRTRTPLRVGRRGEPVAELTRFGWSVMAPGVETDVLAGFLAVDAIQDYEKLCSLDVLGLADTPAGDQQEVYKEFREQLSRNPEEGWYETGLSWKGDHPPLPSNREGSLRRLRTQVTKLRHVGKLKEYDQIIKDQLEEGVVELAPRQPVGREYYMPHRAVIKESAETTKLRVVYDCSARGEKGSPSLNDCLEPGPALQNKLWDVLVRGRFHSVVLAGDMRKAFLQVRIREEERDALRFFWLKDLDSSEIQTLRFTRALFGLAPSPFLLGGVVEQHLESWNDRLPDSVAEILRSRYVDDLISGGSTVSKAKELKSDAKTIFSDGGFQLHKWHSNVPKLESDAEELPADNGRDLQLHEYHSNAPELDLEPQVQSTDIEDTYAKHQLGSASGEGSKLLGLSWDKVADTLSVTFPMANAEPTKRGILGKLARIYDPLGLVSPMTLQGKFLYRDACELKQAWDVSLPDDLATKWRKWESTLPLNATTRRTLAPHRESIEAVELHGFGDASGRGVAAAVYAVVRQTSGTTQGLVTAKARLAKQRLTIPRLELVAGHMAVNLADNVRCALTGFPVTSVHCWLDSTVALHWIQGDGEYRQFVANRVRKIREHEVDEWRHVPTDQNPADIGSRGGDVIGSALWWNGPEWLQDRDAWPLNPVSASSKESESESKIVREVLAATIVDQDKDVFDQLLERRDFRRALRVCAWVERFVRNCRSDTPKIVGPITAAEQESRTSWWIRRVQSRAINSPKFDGDKLQLNLQPNGEGILECRGRIQGSYPIYLPDDCLFTEKFVQRAHLRTLHGGVALTMANVRERHWVPRLRQVVKKIIKGCWGCKRFQAQAHAAPPPGLLPRERTEGSTAFEVIGVDFAGPIKYRKSARVEDKAYLVLFACSLSRALHLEVVPNLETVTFLGSLKRLIARRGRPSQIYSDNGRTFIGAARWLKQIRADERIQCYLADEEIHWKFNLSRAPWWGGQFERLIGLFKQSFYKTIGGGMLTWPELCEVVLEVETQLNRRPLSYVEDDVQFPMLTPASFLFQRTNRLPEQEHWREENVDLRKRAKYLKSCKDALWKRWTREYLAALRERHRCNGEGKPTSLNEGDVVLIRSEERNRGKWTVGVVVELFSGRDGVVRGAKLRAGKAFLERPVQHLYPLELSCDRERRAAEPASLNPEAPPYRPRRDAAVAARLRIQDEAQVEL